MTWKKFCGLVWRGTGAYRTLNVRFNTVDLLPACERTTVRLLGTTTINLSVPRGQPSIESSRSWQSNNGRAREESMSYWTHFLGIGSILLGWVLYGKLAGAESQSSTAVYSHSPRLMQSLPSFLTKHVFKSVYCAEGGNPHRRSKQFNFLAEAVETVTPSVVYIEKQEKVGTFFGTAMVMSSGSGFVVDDGTYIVTNAHVVGSARSVKVKLISGRVLTGEVTDIDQIADLALLKLNLPSGERLPALKFGSSSDVRPGEWVVAVGSPLSLENTITAGIVSSVHRPSKDLGLHRYGKPDSLGYVQTDAAITVGNSGGPLVNLDGEVIGVNNMTAGPGISFAIPSDFAQNFVNNATKTVQQKKKQTRSNNRYAIGISMLSLTPNVLRTIRSSLSLPSDVTHGVLVATVWPSGAAAQADLKRGDVIVRVNGKNIESCSELNEMVQSGKRLTMEIVRKSQWKTVTVVPELY